MKVSELRMILALIEKEHGDLVITTHQWNDPNVPHKVEGIEVITVIPNYIRNGVTETYAISGKIRGHGGKKEILQRPLEKVAHIYYDRA